MQARVNGKGPVTAAGVWAMPGGAVASGRLQHKGECTRVPPTAPYVLPRAASAPLPPVPRPLGAPSVTLAHHPSPDTQFTR